ncbi:hypothetical protein BE221DRAFT_191737 [Ostreococcus tauri]|uniref:Uncharacterized protein n=1 Tax=Ostreococcus tauri TaxID=70448 RepID=A0A1Y5IB54_OSTTA|nr:hypothetical protein BE221DRAFT_191737 [Ostreococcus tauri]
MAFLAPAPRPRVAPRSLANATRRACARTVIARADGGDDRSAPDVGPLTKRGKPMPERQKPRRRKPKTNGPTESKPAPPTAEELTASARYDDIVAAGGVVFEVFVRAKGPNQWFPVGPLAVKSPRAVKREIWAAEQPLRTAALKMYPALAKPPAFGNLEYGYRERDESSKITEAEIREKKGQKNPFDDVVLLTKEDDSSESEEESIFVKLSNSFKKALNPYDA